MPLECLTKTLEIFKCSNCNACPLKKYKNGENDINVTHSKGENQKAEEDSEPIRYIPHKPVNREVDQERTHRPLPQTPPEIPPQTTTEENLGVYKALFSFEGRTEEELSFEKDDLFRVTERCGDWWKADKLVDGQVVASGVVPYNYLVKGEALDAHPWYFGKLTRSESQNLLLTSTNPEGAFLVRRSEKDDVGYVLSVKECGKVRHFKILQKEALFYVQENQTFADVEALVEHYRSHKLSSLQITEACVRREPETQDLSHRTVDDWEIPKSEFTLDHHLGSGYFAEVYRGKWKGTINVAIKVLKNNDDLDQREFMLETQMLKRLRHRNLISLFAICTESMPYFIITEFMAKGDLLKFLRGPEGKNMDIDSLIDMSIQVSEGMAYLESENSIHRDLAARNVLVGEDNTCKVADFGLARVIKEPFYLSEDKTIPYKWTAPEAISHGRFSCKSDVWSFGVLLYEIFTYGGSPYPTYNNNDVYDLVVGGYRMPCPPKFPENIYEIMLMCWAESPNERPDFKDLASLLLTSHSYNE